MLIKSKVVKVKSRYEILTTWRDQVSVKGSFQSHSIATYVRINLLVLQQIHTDSLRLCMYIPYQRMW